MEPDSRFNTAKAELFRVRQQRLPRIVLFVAPAAAAVFFAVQKARGVTITGASATNAVKAFSLVLTLFSIALGASAIAGEHAKAALASELSYEPRRGRLLVTRQIIMAISCGVITAVLMAVLLAGLTVLKSGSQAIDAWLILRAVVGAGAAAALGVAAGAICRSAVAVVIASWGLFFVVEPALGSLHRSLPKYGSMLNLLQFSADRAGTLSAGTSVGWALAVSSAWTLGLSFAAVYAFRRHIVHK